MELGAVVMVPAESYPALLNAANAGFATPSANSQQLSRMPILGNDVLRSWTERIRKLGIKSLWLTSIPNSPKGTAERTIYSALADVARQGVERLLFIKLKSYAEMDLADLLRFHRETHSPVTEARDNQGQLGVSLLDRHALHAAEEEDDSFCAPTGGGRMPYRFHGYAKRIVSAKERQELVGDGLTGACAMRPLGTQIRDQVWVGEGVSLADSARVIGPTFIGARTIVRAGAVIGPYASIEHDCIVDCGTAVEHSTILPHTYLAPGLLVRHASVQGRYLEDLESAEIADLQPAGLGSSILRRESLKQRFHKAVNTSRPGNAWAFAPFPTTSQPWQQVQL